jgi:hypothetical protein
MGLDLCALNIFQSSFSMGFFSAHKKSATQNTVDKNNLIPINCILTCCIINIVTFYLSMF